MSVPSTCVCTAEPVSTPWGRITVNVPRDGTGYTVKTVSIITLYSGTCIDNMCMHGGTCIDTVGLYYCKCPSGWDGIHCENSKYSYTCIVEPVSTLWGCITVNVPRNGTGYTVKTVSIIIHV